MCPQLTSVNAIAATVSRTPPRSSSTFWTLGAVASGRRRAARRAVGGGGCGCVQGVHQPGAARQQQGAAGVELPQLGVEDPQLLGRGRKMRHARSVVRVTPYGMSAGTQDVLRSRAKAPCAGRIRPWTGATTASAVAGPCPRRPPPCTTCSSGPTTTRAGGRQVREVIRIDDTTGTVRIRSVLPYDLTFTAREVRRDPAAGILEIGMTGDLDGWARWTLTADGTGTLARYDQEVDVTKPLLRRLAVPGRPVFRANHALMMRAGRRGLLAYLAAMGKRFEPEPAGTCIVQSVPGRLAQWESASFTPKRSLVRTQYRPPGKAGPSQRTGFSHAAAGSSGRSGHAGSTASSVPLRANQAWRPRACAACHTACSVCSSAGDSRSSRAANRRPTARTTSSAAMCVGRRVVRALQLDPVVRAQVGERAAALAVAVQMLVQDPRIEHAQRRRLEPAVQRRGAMAAQLAVQQGQIERRVHHHQRAAAHAPARPAPGLSPPSPAPASGRCAADAPPSARAPPSPRRAPERPGSPASRVTRGRVARRVLDDDGGRHDPVGLDVHARGLRVECGQGPLVPARHAPTTPRSPAAADVPSSARFGDTRAVCAVRRKETTGVRVCAVQRPVTGTITGTARKAVGHGASRSPNGAGCCPSATAPLRGTLATTACMETLQVGYLHAVAAAAGCSLSQPFPDNGIDWHVSHSAPGHTVDDEVTIKVQLKATYQLAPHPPGRPSPSPSTTSTW